MFPLSKHIDMCLNLSLRLLVLCHHMWKTSWIKIHEGQWYTANQACCPQAHGYISQRLFVDYYCSDIPVLGCNRLSCCKTEEAPVAAVCLQPLSIDLWLQVPIMVANFKGLVGSIPTTACCCPCGPLCVCAHKKRDKVSSWVISCLAWVCTSVCVYVCLYVSPSSGFNVYLGRVWKAQATPHSRQAAVESKAWTNVGFPPPRNWVGETASGGPSTQKLCFYTYVFIWVSLCGFKFTAT